jgi:hypothetical protein
MRPFLFFSKDPDTCFERDDISEFSVDAYDGEKNRVIYLFVSFSS